MNGRTAVKYECKICGALFECAEDEPFDDWFEEYGEETLWGHIQNDHPDVFEEVQNDETPFMLEQCYNEV